VKINPETFSKFDAYRKLDRQKKDRVALKINSSLILQIKGVLLTVGKQNSVNTLWGNAG